MIFADRRGFSGKLQFQEFRKFQEFDRFQEFYRNEITKRRKM